MVLTVLRALFVLLMAAVAVAHASNSNQPTAQFGVLSMAVVLAVATLLVVVDIVSPRKKLAVFSSIAGGLLVGLAVAYAGSFVVALLVDRYHQPLPFATARELDDLRKVNDAITSYADLVLGVGCCYLAISFILQTQDDFRFVIPYVEFSKQTKGARPILLDTSVLIDGRITDVAATGILESQLVVPQFVLDELQRVADSGDRVSRDRGRLGLDVLTKLRKTESVEVVLYDRTDRPADATSAAVMARLPADADDVDQRLIDLALKLNARVLTNDFNLSHVARFKGVSVVNLNAVADAMKPVVRVGERMRVTIQKPGDQPGQGVGYLSDGTMVVVEQARGQVAREVSLTVTNTRQTPAGRMIFGRLVADPQPAGTQSAGTQPAGNGRG